MTRKMKFSDTYPVLYILAGTIGFTIFLISIVTAHLFLIFPQFRSEFENQNAYLIYFSAVLVLFYSAIFYHSTRGKNKVSEGVTWGGMLEYLSRGRMRCDKCGSFLTKGKEVCDRCGKETPRCVFCRKLSSEDDQLVQYVCCQTITHVSHVKIWEQKHMICPYCRTYWPKKVIVE